jgi:hypothetical protein
MNAITLLKFILKNGANPNQKIRYNNTELVPITEILQYYVDKRRVHDRALEVLKILLDYGADPTYEGYYVEGHNISPIRFAQYLTENIPNREPFITACLDLFDEYIRRSAMPPSYGISIRKTTRTPKRKTRATKRKASKRKSPKRKASKRKTKTSKRKVTKRR